MSKSIGKSTSAKASAKAPRSSPAGKARKLKTASEANTSSTTDSGSPLIDQRIASFGDWRGQTLTELRRLIHEADPDVMEECKWAKASNPLGVPVWSHAGMVCTGEAYKEVVKLTFARGAALKDPQRLFNASLDGGTRRAIDIREGEMPDAKAFKALIQAAVAENLRSGSTKSKSTGSLS